jgi:hypothetical protein
MGLERRARAALKRLAARHAMAFVILGLLSFALGGCAIPASLNPLSSVETQTASPSMPKLAWAHNDGRLISGSPELTAPAQTDVSECRATIPPVRTHMGVAGEGCMNERRYYVREIP